MSDPYLDFVAAKVKMAERVGFDVPADAVHPLLKPHQRDAVRWACAGGRRALFEAFGLGKSVQQIEILRLCREYAGGPVLIVCPLGVRQEFKRDAAMLGVATRFVRADAEVDPEFNGIHLTNYESVRDGRLDPNLFTAASLDEASVLRSFGSKTYQTFLTLFDRVRYRFVATATPSPNRFKELIHYAGFLGVMDTGQALTRWFKRDSTKANNLTLYPHKEREFWLWVASWALFLQRPSDLGYDDTGYDLPGLKVVYHEVKVDHGGAQPDRDGQGNLFRDAALGVIDAAREKRDTLPARVAAVRAILDSDPDSHYLIWHDLEAERHALEAALPRARYHHWDEVQDGHPVGLELFERHYSALKYRDGRERDRFAGPGFKTVLINRERNALFVWRKFIDDSGQNGINCAVFRNEGSTLSSELIKEAMAIAWQRWPGERLYTYVNARRIESSNPGYCFQRAGWRKCGRSKTRGLVILEALPGADVPVIERLPGVVSVYGDQDLDEREDAVIAFSEGRIQYLSAKPVLAGSGCNFQRHCHKAIYAGVGFKFNDFIQSVHRIQRFLQQHPVEIHIVHAESEREVLRTLQAKWTQHNELVAKMSEIIREHGLSAAAMASVLQRAIGVERIEASGNGWVVANNDCVAETRSMAENSVDLVVTSIPFANHYEYSPSYNDFGHTEDNAHFWRQMDFLTPELLRVLKPGRLACIHVKDRIQFGAVTGAGAPTVSPFHAEAIFHYRSHGFDYMGLITIVTDVVRENNQTYRLGWSEQCKDGTKMGVGSPEYIVLVRKPQTDRTRGYADEPVRKDKAAYSRARWQVDAHAMWRSSGNRQLTADELAGLGPDALAKLFTEYSLQNVYDFATHVRIGEALDARGALPSTFMSLAPGSHRDDVWHDVNRMLTLNGEQTKRGLENHICPLQFDIVDRLIERYSNPGDEVYDPFGGLFTVPYRAVLLGRRGRAAELSTSYFLDGVQYLNAAEAKASMPSLFDAIPEVEAA